MAYFLIFMITHLVCEAKWFKKILRQNCAYSDSELKTPMARQDKNSRLWTRF